jgi:hypothetical protein
MIEGRAATLCFRCRQDLSLCRSTAAWPAPYEYICGIMAEVDMFKKFDFLFSVDISYLNEVL